MPQRITQGGTSLFLNLKEVAYQSKMAYEKPSDITISLGEWNVTRADGIVTTITSAGHRLLQGRTFSRIMGHEDLAADLHQWEDEHEQHGSD